MAKKSANFLGAIAFLIGVVLAVILGAFSAISATMAVVLAVLGIIVGLLNIGDKEVTPFLLAAVSLVIVSSFGADALAPITGIGWLYGIFNALLILFVPATIIVALKQVFSLAKK